MSRHVVLHPDTGKYVLCEIQGSVATVIEEYPSFESSTVQDTPAPAISVNHQQERIPAPPLSQPWNDQVFAETVQVSLVPLISVSCQQATAAPPTQPWNDPVS